MVNMLRRLHHSAQYVRCAINYGEQWLFAVYEAPTYGSRPVFRRSDIMTFSHDDFQDLLGTILNLVRCTGSSRVSICALNEFFRPSCHTAQITLP